MTRRTTASLDLCERSRAKGPTITATPALAAEAALGIAGRLGPSSSITAMIQASSPSTSDFFNSLLARYGRWF
jgi:hypothetical protein